MKVEQYAVITDGHIAGFDYPREGARMPANRVLMTPELRAKWETIQAENEALDREAEAKGETVMPRLVYDGDIKTPVRVKDGNIRTG